MTITGSGSRTGTEVEVQIPDNVVDGASAHLWSSLLVLATDQSSSVGVKGKCKVR